jgi:hypothetical protein
MKNAIIGLIVAACATLALPASAEADADAEALRERVERAVLEWLDGRDGVEAGETLDVSLQLPEQHVADVGIVFDGTWDSGADVDGLRIVALRPGGAGARMGLREGDRIMAVNGIDLRHLGETGDGRARAAGALSSLVAGHGPEQPMRVTVKRGEAEHELSGTLDTRYLPPIHLALGQAAMAATQQGLGGAVASTRGCGEISSFAPPPRARDLYPVMIVGIDGSEWASGNRSTWRVPAGTYQVRMVELISDSRLRVPGSQRGFTKTLEVTVEADHTYEFGARFVQDRRYRGVRGDYWEPVIWRSEPKDCRRTDFWPRRGGRD